MKKHAGIIATPFENTMPVPDVKGDWGGKLDNLEGGRGATPDELKGTDHAQIEGAPGIGERVAPKPFPGS